VKVRAKFIRKEYTFKEYTESGWSQKGRSRMTIIFTSAQVLIEVEGLGAFSPSPGPAYKAGLNSQG
jgi:hypothetical protein